jgi:hypothetical protein
MRRLFAILCVIGFRQAVRTPLVLALLLCAASAQAAPAFVQGAVSGTASTTFTTANLTTGNMIVACMDYFNASSVTVVGITDATTGSNTFTDAGFGRYIYGAPDNAMECWYAKNITGGAKDTITVSFSGGRLVSLAYTCRKYPVLEHLSLSIKPAKGTEPAALP